MKYLRLKPKQLLHKAAFILVSVVSLVFGQGFTHAFAADCPAEMSAFDCNSLIQNFPDYVPRTDCSAKAAAANSGSIALTPLSGATVEEKVWNYLIGKGLTPQQAAGVMGNMQAESGINPTRHQGTGEIFNNLYTGNAWGIVQWDGGRRYSPPSGGILGSMQKNYPNLIQYTALSYDTVRNPGAVIPPTDYDQLLAFELDYMYNESISRPVNAKGYGNAGNEWATLKLQTTVEDATVFWHNNFEVSADSAQRVLQTRGGYAAAIFAKYGNGATATASTLCATPTGFVQTLMAYAWPEYKGSPYLIPMPLYASAVATAQQNGIYTGGFDGADCGGFVTLLMLNSGFEPNYNYGGKWSAGAGNVAGGQIPWLQANWTQIGTGSTINPANLRAGDVAVSPTHTFVWVADAQGNPPTGFGAKIASASFGDRMPMADTRQSPTASSFTWYRKR